MNGPFFRNYSKQQPSRSVPAQQRSSPKVISVPVHFISSDQPRMTMSTLKDSAAIKIQKVFRGFVVRKSVRRIDSLRNSVDEIERRINDIEVVNLIRSDAKERLRVNETLMSLLLKLDSIRSVDGGIRDLRKAVTRKAIALQEKVDSIAQQTLDSPEMDTSTSEQVTEVHNSVDNHVNLEAIHLKKHKENREIVENLMDENEKMMKLICETNEMQTRMINSLNRRVDQLEKVLRSEKLRKKKKTHRRWRDTESFCI